jgi:hypothetical protein
VIILILARNSGAGVPTLMVVTLLIAMYLTVIELRELRPLHWRWWAWWLAAVFLIHFPAYLGLRGYAYWRRRRASVH